MRRRSKQHAPGMRLPRRACPTAAPQAADEARPGCQERARAGAPEGRGVPTRAHRPAPDHAAHRPKRQHQPPACGHGMSTRAQDAAMRRQSIPHAVGQVPRLPHQTRAVHRTGWTGCFAASSAARVGRLAYAPRRQRRSSEDNTRSPASERRISSHESQAPAADAPPPPFPAQASGAGAARSG